MRIAVGLAAAAALAAVIFIAWNRPSAAQDRIALLDGHVEFLTPETPAPGRGTLVLLLSGCGGLVGDEGPKTIMDDYARAANEAGAHVAIIDSLGARDIGFDAARSQVCSGLRLRGRQRAGDLVAARTLAEAHWGGPFETVIAAGWSHGGWAVMEQLRLDAGDDAPRLDPDAVVLVYPYCGRFNSSRRGGWAFRGPILHLSAEEDPLSPAETCREIIVRAHGGPQGVETVVFEGVTHAFDESDQTPESRYIYDPGTAAEAHARFAAFIQTVSEE